MVGAVESPVRPSDSHVLQQVGLAQDELIQFGSVVPAPGSQLDVSGVIFQDTLLDVFLQSLYVPTFVLQLNNNFDLYFSF